jgi:hypothetical protein
MTTRDFLYLLGCLVVIGCTALVAGTRWGIGASPDSVYYIGAARNMLEGRGYSIPAADGSDTPLTHLPPFYSAVLALLGTSGLAVMHVARWINIFFFGAGTLLVGLLIGHWAGPGERWIALLGAIIFLTSNVVLEIHLMAWSEPLFILLGLLSLIMLGRYLDSQKTGWLVASAILTSLTFLTRFAGAAFVITGVIGILLFAPAKQRRRLRDTLLFTGLSTLPILVWLINNMVVAGTVANREFVFHPIGKHQVSQALTTLASWLFIPDTARTVVKLGVIVLLALGVCAAFGLVMRQEKNAESGPVFMHLEAIPMIVKLLVIFLLVYPAILVFSLTFFDANTPLDRRILSPIFVLALVLICYALIEVFNRLGKQSIIKWAVVILICVFCTAYLAKGAGLLVQSYREGNGFNSATWQGSQTLKSLQQLPRRVYIYSNAPDGIFLQTGRPASVLPEKFDVVEQRPNLDFNKNMEIMLDRIEDGGVLVYFSGLDWPNLPDEQELVQALPLRVLGQYSDGTIYAAAPK